ncbi:MAG: HAD-IIIA family hydrolase [Bacillota bacterium]|nr:HAD-IIIA family hydrolase [Bacillota bacterium]
MISSINDFFIEITKLAYSLDYNPYNGVLSEIKRASQGKRTIFLIGNGSSSNIVSHFANDLMKNAGANITKMLGIGLKVISIPDNMPFLTAVSNDVNFDSVYLEYLKIHASPEDLLIIFSSGTPHRNLIEAARFSYLRGLRVAAVTGSSIGELTLCSHVLYRVNCEVPEKVEAIHTFLCHSWSVQLRKELVQPVVFLDRDGVVNKNRSDYVKSWEEFRFLPGVSDAIRRLNEKGFAVIIVTNQSAVGRNIISPGRLDEIHNNMYHALYNEGAMISGIYYCPHTPFDNCNCRKPKNGLIEKAFNELPLDMEKGIMIGDNVTDIEAGRISGLTTILLGSGSIDYEKEGEIPHYFMPDLPSAVDFILSKTFSYKKECLKHELEAI